MKLLDLGADQSLRDEFGGTPLSWAQGAGHTEIARLLRQTEKNRRKGARANTDT